jgi:hypothetical protein
VEELHLALIDPKRYTEALLKLSEALMRRLFGLLFALFMWASTSLVLAEVPQKLHYQGYLTDGAGDPVHCPDTLQCEQAFDLTVRLYAEAEGGAVLWQEIHPQVAIYQGSFHLTLGEVEPISGPLLENPTWLAIKVNDNLEMDPRQSLVSAAYAIRASSSDSATTAVNASQLGGIDAAEYIPGPKFSGQYTDLEGVPAGLADGDNDTLAGLSCSTDEVARWNGIAWVCSDASQGVPVLSEPPPCGPENAGMLYFDTDTNRLMLCDGTSYQSLRVCSDTCPAASTFACGLDVMNDCGSPCGVAGTGPNPSQCAASSAVCGEPVFDGCGNTCGVSGSALNATQCANVVDATCGTVIQDSCGNACGTIGVGLNPDQCADGASLNCGVANTDNCDNACSQPTGTFCPTPQFCSGGVCACDGGLTACGNGCVNLNTDTANCGSCGNTCAADQGCVAGVCSSSISYGPQHTFNGMTSEHFITQGGCNPGGGAAEGAEYFCQSFYGTSCHAEPGATSHSTPFPTYPKMHKVSGCTNSGSDIPGSDCDGQPCHIGDWSENTSGVGNIICTCTP